MKCNNCGAELPDNTNTCTYCGEKLNNANSEKNENEESKEKKSKKSTNTVSKKSKNVKSKDNTVNQIKQKLCGKESLIVGIIEALMCLIAFSSKIIGSSLIALLGVIFCVVSFLMQKDIIKSPKSWLSKAFLILAIVLIIPYVAVYNTNIAYSKAKNFDWNDMVLSNVLPEPKSHLGEIYSNSKDGLSLYIYKTSSDDYDNYIKECKNKGFTIDIEQLGDLFNAYNAEGYSLSLMYDKTMKKMRIDLDSPMELGTFEWPDSEYTKLIPKPESNIGKVQKNDETGFEAYVGNVTKEKFKDYIKQCVDKGFNIESTENDKSYTAKNGDNYKLNVEYKANNIIKITIYEPEYEVDLEIRCSQNLMFSKYDVKVYVDEYSYQGTLKHGTTETYKITLKKGIHTVNFENVESSSVKGETKIKVTKQETIKLEIRCTNSQIDVTGGISGEEITMIDVKGLDAESAKNKLNEIGFTNVTVKGDDGNNMVFEDDSKWEVVSQSEEAGAQVDKIKEILLTCHKKEEPAPEPEPEPTPTPSNENSSTTVEQTQTETIDYSDITYRDDAEDVFRMQIEDSSPYGVKIHSITGYLAKTYEGNGIWFFKVKITQKNAFNAKQDKVAEGRIDVAHGNDITYFIIY